MSGVKFCVEVGFVHMNNISLIVGGGCGEENSSVKLPMHRLAEIQCGPFVTRGKENCGTGLCQSH